MQLCDTYILFQGRTQLAEKFANHSKRESRSANPPPAEQRFGLAARWTSQRVHQVKIQIHSNRAKINCSHLSALSHSL